MVEALRLARLDALVEEGLAKNPDLAATGRSLAAAAGSCAPGQFIPDAHRGRRRRVSRKRALTMPGLPDPTKLYNVYTARSRRATK